MPGLGKEETTVFMTNNSKIKYEQSQNLSLPTQSMNQKGLYKIVMYMSTNLYTNIKSTCYPSRRTN